jgi:hypothetical protein
MAGGVTGRLAWPVTALEASREESCGWPAFAGHDVESAELS